MTDTPTEREEGGAWAKLRRRKVVQWGIAYAAGAWGFLQGLAYVSELLEWPAQLQKLTGLALLSGLPITLVLAWYHGDRGERRVSRTELTILTLLFLVGGGLFWRYQHTTESPTPTAVNATAMTGAPVAAGPSIAVLPFENRSKRDDDVFFVDGIHDDILTQLSKVSALKVISRTSVEQFRDTKLPIKSIAEQLGVKSVLEGGVQRGGERVRINVQLIDAGTDVHLWAETYDRELTAENIFAIQTELATAITGALRATLTEEEKARVEAVPTQNLEAWEAYQLGKQRMVKRTSDSLADAEQFFRKAITLDSSFALAHVGLADALRLQTDYSGKPLETTLALAEDAAEEALKLDPNLAEAWASQGGIALSRGNNEQAEELLRRAIRINPNYALAHQWLSLVLTGSGRLREELEHSERAAQLDPLSVSAQVNLGGSMNLLGRFDEAEARYRRAIELDPTSPWALDAIALLNAYARNRFANAVLLQDRAVALDNDSPQLAGDRALLWLDLDDAARATDLGASVARKWPDDVTANVYAAGIAAAVGHNAIAEAHASKALAAYPRTPSLVVAVLRNADLRRGDAQAARGRYAAGYPELLSADPRVNLANLALAVDLALVFQQMNDVSKASALLDASELAIRTIPRLGMWGYGIADVQIHALRGDKTKALAALREAGKAGWRGPGWRYYRDIDPNLDSIRDEPEFKAVFADIERDMARQRAELAARPKDAPLELESN